MNYYLHHNYFGKNIKDYELESCIFLEGNVLWVTGSVHEFVRWIDELLSSTLRSVINEPVRLLDM